MQVPDEICSARRAGSTNQPEQSSPCAQLPRALPGGYLVPDRVALQCATATCSRAHALAEPFDRGLRAALAVRDAERAEPDFDDAERAEHHRGIDVAHVGDAERLAGQVADADAEHDAALFVAIFEERN